MFVRFCSSQHVALTLPQNKCICNYKGRNYLGVFFLSGLEKMSNSQLRKYI